MVDYCTGIRTQILTMGTQALVTRLSFGSASDQAAPPLPLLTLLLTFCPASAIRSPVSDPLLLFANHALPITVTTLKLFLLILCKYQNLQK